VKLVLKLPIDEELSTVKDAAAIEATAKAWLDHTMTAAMRNPYLTSVEDVLGEGLAEIGIFLSEDDDAEIEVEPGG
jgi:hypothetical protein